MTNLPDWTGAACAGVDPDLFFPEGKGGHTLVATLKAKAICSTCPVLQQCKTYALETPVGYTPEGNAYGWMDGVWGGTTKDERVELRAGGLLDVA